MKKYLKIIFALIIFWLWFNQLFADYSKSYTFPMYPVELSYSWIYSSNNKVNSFLAFDWYSAGFIFTDIIDTPWLKSIDNISFLVTWMPPSTWSYTWKFLIRTWYNDLSWSWSYGMEDTSFNTYTEIYLDNTLKRYWWDIPDSAYDLLTFSWSDNLYLFWLQFIRFWADVWDTIDGNFLITSIKYDLTFSWSELSGLSEESSWSTTFNLNNGSGSYLLFGSMQSDWSFWVDPSSISYIATIILISVLLIITLIFLHKYAFKLGFYLSSNGKIKWKK